MTQRSRSGGIDEFFAQQNAERESTDRAAAEKQRKIDAGELLDLEERAVSSSSSKELMVGPTTAGKSAGARGRHKKKFGKDPCAYCHLQNCTCGKDPSESAQDSHRVVVTFVMPIELRSFFEASQRAGLRPESVLAWYVRERAHLQQSDNAHHDRRHREWNAQDNSRAEERRVLDVRFIEHRMTELLEGQIATTEPLDRNEALDAAFQRARRDVDEDSQAFTDWKRQHSRRGQPNVFRGESFHARFKCLPSVKAAVEELSRAGGHQRVSPSVIFSGAFAIYREYCRLYGLGCPNAADWPARSTPEEFDVIHARLRLSHLATIFDRSTEQESERAELLRMYGAVRRRCACHPQTLREETGESKARPPQRLISG